MRVRYPPPPRNADALPLFAWADSRPAPLPLGARARWLRQRHPLSPQRAELIATLAFGVRERS
jgi:hypothetical protein